MYGLYNNYYNSDRSSKTDFSKYQTSYSISNDWFPQNYSQWKDYLQGKTERPVCNNTRVYELETGAITIKYHATYILTFYPDGKVEFNTEGWTTRTTQERINKFQDIISVWQEKGQWEWDFNCREGIDWGNYRFSMGWVDGLLILDNGDHFMILNKFENYTYIDYNEIKKRIDKYVNNYFKALMNMELDKPGGGDCFICGLGHEHYDWSHIESHMDEPYYVPTLFFNAMYWNYGKDELGRIKHMAQVDLWNMGYLFKYDEASDYSGFALDLFESRNKKVFKAYLMHVYTKTHSMKGYK